VNRRGLLLGAALVGAAGLAVFGDRTPDQGATVEAVTHRDEPAEAVEPKAAPASTPARRKRAAEILALQPRQSLIGHEIPTEPPALFGSRTLIQSAEADDKPAAAPPAEAPPLPFTYLGKKYENATWEVFLAIGDHTYFVREGSVIDQAYAVNSIRPPVMTLTFIPMNKMQTLTIGGAE